jgi:hypothetical protein
MGWEAGSAAPQHGVAPGRRRQRLTETVAAARARGGARRRGPRDRLGDVPHVGADHRRPRRRRATTADRDPVLSARIDPARPARTRQRSIGSSRRLVRDRPGGREHVRRGPADRAGRGLCRLQPDACRPASPDRCRAISGQRSASRSVLKVGWPAGDGDPRAARSGHVRTSGCRRPADVSARVAGSTVPPAPGLPGVWARARVCEDGHRRQGEGGCRHEHGRENGTGSAKIHGCAPVRPNPWREEARSS